MYIRLVLFLRKKYIYAEFALPETIPIRSSQQRMQKHAKISALSIDTKCHFVTLAKIGKCHVSGDPMRQRQ